MNDIQSSENSNRRNLLRGAFAGVAGLAAVSLLAPQAAKAAIPSTIPGTGDIQVLNFALALEDLEADLYAQALLRLTTGGTDPQGVATIPGLGVATTEIDVAYITKFSSVEAAHRDFLKTAIGAAGGPVITTVMPAKYDFGIQSLTRQQVLDLVLEAEATGVQAYLGAIPSFAAQSKYLPTAAAIQGTEARHTSVLTIVRNILYGPITPVAPLKGDAGTTPTATSYSAASPNTGTPEGRDLTLAPDQVLARVSGFIKYQ